MLVFHKFTPADNAEPLEAGFDGGETRLVALRRLESHSDPEITHFAREQTPLLIKSIDSAPDWETKLDRDRDERFEY